MTTARNGGSVSKGKGIQRRDQAAPLPRTYAADDEERDDESTGSVALARVGMGQRGASTFAKPPLAPKAPSELEDEDEATTDEEATHARRVTPEEPVAVNAPAPSPSINTVDLAPTRSEPEPEHHELHVPDESTDASTPDAAPSPGTSAIAIVAQLASAAAVVAVASRAASRRSFGGVPANQPSASSSTPFIVHGGGALTRELIAACPSLQGDPYEAPWYLTNTHAQTVIGYARMLSIWLKYDRELVRCEDGGQVGLDWLVHARFTRPAPAPQSIPAGLGGGHTGLPRTPRPVAARHIPRAVDLPQDAPVFIMLHGINGGSHEGPLKWAMAAGAVRGWRCVGLNLRGCNGVPLTSPKVYCAASSEDVRAAVEACKARYPSAPILLAGYSLGTYVILTYLAEEDSRRRGEGRDLGRGNGSGNNVAGAVLISCPLDPHSSHAGLSDPARPMGLIYNRTIASQLRRYFTQHKDVVNEHPHVDDGLEMSDLSTIKDFERALIIKTHHFASLDDYYEYISPARIIPCVRTPTLFLSARDDPFMGHSEECEAAMRASKHVAMAHVRMGGHVAFLEKGVGIAGASWTDRVLGEFLEATLARRSAAAVEAAASAGPAPYVVSREHASGGLTGRLSLMEGEAPGVDRAAREGLRSHVDPTSAVHARSKL